MIDQRYEQEGSGDSRSRGNYSDNSMYINATALQMRLNTNDTIKKFENFLKGRTTITEIDKATGEPVEILISEGEPLLNQFGIQWVLGQVTMVANPHVVQGNFDKEDYVEYLVRTRNDFKRQLMINWYKFNCDYHQYGSIISEYMRFMEAFISRLIDNKERESYAQSIRSNEVLSTKTDRGGIKIPFLN